MEISISKQQGKVPNNIPQALQVQEFVERKPVKNKRAGSLKEFPALFASPKPALSPYASKTSIAAPQSQLAPTPARRHWAALGDG